MPGLTITKTHGSRNDILVVDGAPEEHLAGGEVARAVELLCDRDRGLGADGAYFVSDDDGIARAWFFNPDGTEALLCGNGMRGVGRLLLDRRETESVVVRTGPYAFTVRDSGVTPHGVRQVAVELPPVNFTPTEAVVADVRWPFVDQPLPTLHPSRRVSALAVPNAHLVSVVNSYNEDELVEAGHRVAESPEVFPLGANLSYVLPLNEAQNEVFIRTYERGAGLTASCGSGIAASRAVLSRLERVAPQQPVLVRNPGGVARSWLQEDGDTWQPVLEGNATLVGRWELDPATLRGDGPLEFTGETYEAETSAFDSLSEENAKALDAAGVRASAAA